MNRQLINQELARFGITEDQYVTYFVSLLRQKPFDEVLNQNKIIFHLDREAIIALEHVDRAKGTVEYEPMEIRDILRITESGEFLERMKERAFGKFYARMKYC
jgi:hypothetical protein